MADEEANPGRSALSIKASADAYRAQQAREFAAGTGFDRPHLAAVPPVDEKSPEYMVVMCHQAAQALEELIQRYGAAVEYSGRGSTAVMEGLLQQLKAAQADKEA